MYLALTRCMQQTGQEKWPGRNRPWNYGGLCPYTHDPKPVLLHLSHTRYHAQGCLCSLDCSQSLGKSFKRRPTCSWVCTQAPGPAFVRWLPGIPSTDGEPLPGTVPWVGDPEPAGGLLPPARGSAPGWGPPPSPPAPAHTPGRWRLWRSGEGPRSPGTAGKGSEGP